MNLTQEVVPPPKKLRVDGQMTGLAGELFVAAELLKRNLQTSITFGNAKQIDLLAHNSKTGRHFAIQVKALRAKNYFLIGHGRIQEDHMYVFVLLNKPDEAVQYFIVPGEILAKKPEGFGPYFQDQTFPGIHPKFLTKFASAWHYFEAAST